MIVRIIDIYPSRKRRVLRLYYSVPPDWLEAVLRNIYYKKGYYAFVTINSLLYVESGRGRKPVFSDMIAVTVDAQVNRQQATHHFIIKLLPIRPCCRYYRVRSNLDLREIKFYTEISNDLMEFQMEHIRDPRDYIRLPIAKCYYARYMTLEERERRGVIDTTEESVIVLEDLLYLDYLPVDHVRGLSVRQVEIAFESISRIHALTLAMKVWTNTPLRERYDFLYQTDHRSNCFEELINRGFPRLIRFLRTREGTEPIIRGLYDIKFDVKYLMEALLTPDEPISVMTHTDFWANNLMFRGNECVILDWQMIACGRPTNDLALLLATSVTTRNRRRYTQRFLSHYYMHLREYTSRLGVDIERELGYSRARLSEDFRRSLVLAMLLCIGNIDLILGNRICENRLLMLLDDLRKNNLLAMNILPIHYLNF